MQNNNKASEKNSIKKTEGQNTAPTRSWKTNQRQKYFLERELIRQEIGDLDQIRQKLGLSQRRLCQLLLVDPSAWTRWLRTSAPPHIFQALRWLLQIRATNPEVVGPRDLESRVDLIQSSTQEKIAALETQVTLLERELALRNAAPATTVLHEAAPALEVGLKNEISRLTMALNGLISQKQAAQKPPAPRKTSAKHRVLRRRTAKKAPSRKKANSKKSKLKNVQLKKKKKPGRKKK